MSIKISNWEVVGWEHAIRGMRNPMNSWEKSDSYFMADRYSGNAIDILGNIRAWPDEMYVDNVVLGKNDKDLMMKLAKSGKDHRKFMRMLIVYLDILAPLYWWKEFDTYKVGTVANSCSTMHKLTSKPFDLSDFSFDHLIDYDAVPLKQLNYYRDLYLQTKDKMYWWQIIQLLPSSYNQKRTIMLNYEVLSNIYHARKDHKLDEWRVLCEWIETLPYSEIITV